jgi:hypothetical protein
MVLEHQPAYNSQRAAIRSIAAKLGCTSATLRSWVRQGERDAVKRSGLTTGERRRLKHLKRFRSPRRPARDTRPAARPRRDSLDGPLHSLWSTRFLGANLRATLMERRSTGQEGTEVWLVMDECRGRVISGVHPPNIGIRWQVAPRVRPSYLSVSCSRKNWSLLLVHSGRQA